MGIDEHSFDTEILCSCEHNLTAVKTSDEHLKIVELEAEIKRLNSILEERDSLINSQKNIESLDNAMRILEDLRQKTLPIYEEEKKENPKCFFKGFFQS